jgi:hypothetical protein
MLIEIHWVANGHNEGTFKFNSYFWSCKFQVVSNIHVEVWGLTLVQVGVFLDHCKGIGKHYTKVGLHSQKKTSNIRYDHLKGWESSYENDFWPFNFSTRRGQMNSNLGA